MGRNEGSADSSTGHQSASLAIASFLLSSSQPTDFTIQGSKRLQAGFSRPQPKELG